MPFFPKKKMNEELINEIKGCGSTLVDPACSIASSCHVFKQGDNLYEAVLHLQDRAKNMDLQKCEFKSDH